MTLIPILFVGGSEDGLRIAVDLTIGSKEVTKYRTTDEGYVYSPESMTMGDIITILIDGYKKS